MHGATTYASDNRLVKVLHAVPTVRGCAGLKARGAKTDAHVSVNSVVERMLAAEAEDVASGEQLPSPESATSPHLPAPPRQKQGVYKAALCMHSEPSLMHSYRHSLLMSSTPILNGKK